MGYLTCALESEDDAVDAFGLNVYSWCDPVYYDDRGKVSFQYSPYYSVVTDFASLPTPVLFTEFGCISGSFEMQCPYSGGRNWTQVEPMFNEMSEVLSGAVAFEFSMEASPTGYGIALTPGFLEGQSSLKLLETYHALRRQYRKHTVSSKWNGADIANCTWLPSDKAPLLHTRPKSVCPTAAAANEMQKRRGVDEVADWGALPPEPWAPLSDVDGQSECPAFEVSAIEAKESCCHMQCSDF